MSFKYKTRQLKALVKKFARIVEEEGLYFQFKQSKSTRERIEARQGELKEQFGKEARALGGYRKAVYRLTSTKPQCIVIGVTPKGRVQIVSLYDVDTCTFKVITASEPVYELPPDDGIVASEYKRLLSEENRIREKKRALERRWRVEQ